MNEQDNHTDERDSSAVHPESIADRGIHPKEILVLQFISIFCITVLNADRLNDEVPGPQRADDGANRWGCVDVNEVP